ncbi:MAG TPA: MATE family efflux transporter [Polyangia bacterium]
MDAVKHMGEQSIGRLLLRYSLPAIAGFLANALYQIVDRILVGRGVGTDGMAAVTSAFPLSIVALALALLVGTGTGNRISVLLGKRDAEGAERVLGQGLRLALINGTVLALVSWIFTTPLLLACGCAPRLLPLAIPFVRIVSIGQIFLISLISMGNILRVQGRPMLGLLIMASSNLLNVGLATLAIFGLHWGITGTALATAISQAAGCLTVIAFVQGKASVLHIRRAFLKADRTLARSIITLGAPFGLMQLFATLVFLAANHGAGGQAGTRGVAALGVLNTVAMFLIYPPLGVMQAMQPLIGFNKGAGQMKRVRAILVRVLLATTAMGALFSILTAIFPGPIAGLFSKSDPELIEMVRRGLPWFTIPITLFGITGTMAHYFLSVHEPRMAGLLLLGRQVLTIPMFVLFPRWFGFYGIYLVGPCADLLFAVIATNVMVRELGKLRLAPDATASP